MTHKPMLVTDSPLYGCTNPMLEAFPLMAKNDTKVTIKREKNLFHDYVFHFNLNGKHLYCNCK